VAQNGNASSRTQNNRTRQLECNGGAARRFTDPELTPERYCFLSVIRCSTTINLPSTVKIHSSRAFPAEKQSSSAVFAALRSVVLNQNPETGQYESRCLISGVNSSETAVWAKISFPPRSLGRQIDLPALEFAAPVL
jgi:hypothetical protein